MENEIIEWVKNSLYSYLGTKMCEGTANKICNIWELIKAKFTKDEESKSIQQIEKNPENHLYQKGFEYFLEVQLHENQKFKMELYKKISELNIPNNGTNSKIINNNVRITGKGNEVTTNNSIK